MSQALLTELQGILGPQGLLQGADIGERYCGDLFGNRGQVPLAVARPRTTAEVSQLLAACNRAGVPVVTQGGRSGLVLSCLPRAGELVLSTERMTEVEAVDPDGCTATVQSGVVLQALQERLEPQGLSFPLDLGGRGSCTIGGNISTNAGGNRVIRYGMTRDLVLGIEAVLADGTVLDGLKPFLKNNTGVDLKQLFVGSEGVLGVVTRAVLRLVPRPEDRCVAFCGVSGFDGVRALLRRLRARLGGELTAFEVLWQAYYTRLGSLKVQRPIEDRHAFYVLAEASGQRGETLQQRFEQALGDALEDGTIADAAIAKSEAEAEALWRMRDMAIEVANTIAPAVPFDISLRIADMPAFVAGLDTAVRAIDPRCEQLVFGHLGDGNLHIAVHRPPELAEAAERIEHAVYGLVARHGGSVSAEHGIGMLKRDFLGHTRSAAEIALMRALKRTMDPKGILNPGRIFEQAH